MTVLWARVLLLESEGARPLKEALLRSTILCDALAIFSDFPDRRLPRSVLLPVGHGSRGAEHRGKRGKTRHRDADGHPFFERQRSRAVVHGGLGGELSFRRRC